MKRAVFLTIAVMATCLIATTTWAQPHGDDLDNDVFGISQGGGNILSVPTPRDDNDNPVGKELDINDAINLLLGTSHAHNSDVDFLRYTSQDRFWTDLSTADNDGTFVFIGLTAAKTNTLRVYDVSAPGTKIKVLPSLSGFDFTGDGSSGDPFLAGFSPLVSGTDFGWNLLSGGDTWDSNPASNPNGFDHMLTYNLKGLTGKTIYIETCTDINNLATCTNKSEYTFSNPFLLAFEDKECVDVGGGKTACGDQDFDDTIFLVDRVAPIVPEPMSMALLGSGLLGLAGIRRRIS